MTMIMTSELKGENFWVTENQVYRVLTFFHQHFKETKYINCVATLHEVATKLAKQIKSNKNHKLRTRVSELVEYLPAHLIF